MPVREAHAEWQGPIDKGQGTMRLGSGAFEGAYSFRTRMEDEPGTNPEELIGAAHAGCFSMALSAALTREGTPPEAVTTDARVRFDREGEGWAITRIDLRTRARVPGVDDEQFQRVAQAAKEGCPVSKALAGVEIALEATLE